LLRPNGGVASATQVALPRWNLANPRHYHPNCDEILTVIQGKIQHTWMDGEDVEMNEGDTITIPSGILHQARNIGSGNAVLMIAFTSADRETVGE
jgi:quercetin dioxygenase-like cupin family protein